MATLHEHTINTSSETFDKSLTESYSICSRCSGLLVKTFCVSPEEGSAGFEIEVMKCLQCGDITDPVILKNRFCTELPNPRPNRKVRFPPIQSLASYK